MSLFGHFWMLPAQNDDGSQLFPRWWAAAEIWVGAGFGDLTEHISDILSPIPACFCLPTYILALFPPKSPEVFLTRGEEQVHLSLPCCGRDLHPWWGEKGMLILGLLAGSGFAGCRGFRLWLFFLCWHFLWAPPTTSSAGSWPCTHPAALKAVSFVTRAGYEPPRWPWGINFLLASSCQAVTLSLPWA